MKLRSILKGPKVNRVIKYFVMADLLFFAGWGFVSPIFSVFIVEEIRDATIVSVGISAAIFWSFRSFVQPPLANALDKMEGEKDDLYALILGLLLAGVTAFMFVLVNTVYQLYVLQIFHGAALGMYHVSWRAIFSRHLDKDRQAFDWSFDSAVIGIAIAVTSFVGSLLASNFGFDVTFIIAGVLSLVAVVIIFVVPDLVLPPSEGIKVGRKFHRHSPPTTH